MSDEKDLEYPDARIDIAVTCENHELESGVKQLNPLLKQILEARQKASPHLKPKGGKNSHFGRLTFSARN